MFDSWKEVIVVCVFLGLIAIVCDDLGTQANEIEKLKITEQWVGKK